ncbi:DMT family transporter [Craterilacuibacter sinensis]|uniref:EamA family transporter n=1 Tax=Craterilacuibacter sinensis TaxID=2686017 RepID=A0A845BKQ1_9NEIS|nr:DMT family transporter [Craterilacuibacter sinensis]MXR37237.1 EamA family transporter [Craterilacuibacter sinensis]
MNIKSNVAVSGLPITQPESVSPVSHLLLPLMFVVLYGSGFVGAKYGLPYCPPLTFLVLRFTIAAALIVVLAMLVRAPWPKSLREILHIAVAGALTVGAFSAGVFVAISVGLSPAISALIIALQPILVAVFARRVLGEYLSWQQWIGLGMGLIGVAFVVWHKIDFSAFQLFGVGMSIIGLFGVTLGNLYQKRFCASMSIFPGGAIQSATSAVLLLPFAVIFERIEVVWHPEFVIALTYMSAGVSIGALSLLYIMIRRGDVSRVASVFYLVPVSAAVASYLLYGEIFDIQVITGVSVVAIGVYFVNSSSNIVVKFFRTPR